MTKIILIGQAGGSARSEPLAGASGRRLAALAGLDLDDFASRFEYRQIDLTPTHSGMQDAERYAILAENRARGDVMRADMTGRKAVLVDRAVASAFGLTRDDYDWFKSVQVPTDIEVAVIPNPGGKSLGWWNDAENEAQAKEWMRHVRLGFLKQPKRRGKDWFTVDEVNAALEAGRGVYSWAAEYLSAASGRSCSAQTIKNYVTKYPDEVNPVMARCRAHTVGGVVKGILVKAEAGDLSALRELAGMRWMQDAAMEHLGIDLRRGVSVEHSGGVGVNHSGTIEVVHRAELENMTPAEKARRYREVVRGECKVVSIDARRAS